MITEVSSKQQLESLASELSAKSSQLGSDISSIVSMLKSVEDYDGINISQAANTIANNLQTIISGINGVIAGISTYASQVSTTDTYGLDGGTPTTNNLGDTGNGNGNYGNTPNGGNNGNNGGNNGYNGSPSGGGGANGSPSGGNPGQNNNGGGAPVVTPIPTPSETPTETTSPEQGSQGQRAEKVVISEGDKDYQVLGNYTNNPEMGFTVTTGNLKYEISDKDFDLLCAIVSSESDLSYDDSLAVVSTILNRCDNGEFVSLYGKDPIAQVTAMNQFASYGTGEFNSYLNGKAPTEVVNAVKDALSGVRNHKFCSYKANSFTDFSNNMITSSGNRYK